MEGLRHELFVIQAKGTASYQLRVGRVVRLHTVQGLKLQIFESGYQSLNSGTLGKYLYFLIFKRDKLPVSWYYYRN